MAEWYLRKSDGTEYGPATIEALRQWAEDGRVAPEDHLSEDRIRWEPAPSIQGLEMEYEVVLQSGERYGPLHILAIRDLAEDGSIDIATPIRHAVTGDIKSVGERLLSVSKTDNDHLRTQLAEITARNSEMFARAEELTEQLAALEARLAERPPEPPPKIKEGTSTIIRGDPSFKDAQKWRLLFETEREQRIETEEKLGNESRELLEQLHEAQSARDRLSYRVNQLEKSLESMQGAMDGEGMIGSNATAAVAESHQQLSDNYEKLLEQLQEKSEELNRLRETQHEVEKEASDRVRRLEERLQRERDEAEKARHRLAELESNHTQVVRSFRDLNDRYIRLRQQLPAPTTSAPRPAQVAPPPAPTPEPESDPEPAPQQPAASEPSPKSAPQEPVNESPATDSPATDSEARPAWKPKVRLT